MMWDQQKDAIATRIKVAILDATLSLAIPNRLEVLDRIHEEVGKLLDAAEDEAEKISDQDLAPDQEGENAF